MNDDLPTPTPVALTVGHAAAVAAVFAVLVSLGLVFCKHKRPCDLLPGEFIHDPQHRRLHGQVPRDFVVCIKGRPIDVKAYNVADRAYTCLDRCLIHAKEALASDRPLILVVVGEMPNFASMYPVLCAELPPASRPIPLADLTAALAQFKKPQRKN